MKPPFLFPAIFVLMPLGIGSSAHAEIAPIKIAAPHRAEEVVFFGVGPRGELRPSEIDLLGDLLRCRRTGRRQPVHPRLAQTLVRVARRFGRPVNVVSGYQAFASNNHPHSYHARGMAADISVTGVPLQDVRDFVVQRRLGGIGYYPHSNFVHIDVRPRRFWWVDYSWPGQREELIPDPEGNAPPVKGRRLQRSTRQNASMHPTAQHL